MRMMLLPERVGLHLLIVAYIPQKIALSLGSMTGRLSRLMAPAVSECRGICATVALRTNLW